jgi:branched-subunit amino acid ABC-type transport system permease component
MWQSISPFTHSDFFLAMVIAVAIAIILTTLLALVGEKAAYRPCVMRRVSRFGSRIGVSFSIENSRYRCRGAVQISPDRELVGTFTGQDILLSLFPHHPGVTLFVFVAVTLMVKKTKIGMAMRAVRATLKLQPDAVNVIKSLPHSGSRLGLAASAV